MANNKTLARAKEEKNDEFYTQLSDIENELRNYKEHFKNKIIFCNCDDPYESYFFKYFAMNFNFLGIKKLIATCYKTSSIANTELDTRDIFNYEEYDNVKKVNSYKVEITEIPDFNEDGAIDLSDVETLLKSDKNTLSPLNGDGDFRSDECIELLKESDIVVTNPPFSLFRNFISTMMEYNKKFLVIGRMSALHYKEIFPLIQKDKIWIGQGFNLSLVYKTPYKNTEEANKKFVRSKGYNPEEGYLKVPAICWYTNLDIKKRHENLILYKKYNELEFPKFENFDAINVDKITDIPEDYYGVMGVPDSYLDKYNPEQFEILGRSGDTDWVINECDFFTPPSEDKIKYYKSINKTWRIQNVYLVSATGELDIVYSRIFIRRRDR